MATVLSISAVDRSTYIITATFTDEDGNSVAPDTLFWTLTNGVGAIVNSREDVEISSPGATETIVLTGDDLAYRAGSNRKLILRGTYSSSLGSGLNITGQANFNVEDLNTIE